MAEKYPEMICFGNSIFRLSDIAHIEVIPKLPGESMPPRLAVKLKDSGAFVGSYDREECQDFIQTLTKLEFIDAASMERMLERIEKAFYY